MANSTPKTRVTTLPRILRLSPNACVRISNSGLRKMGLESSEMSPSRSGIVAVTGCELTAVMM